MGQQDFVEQAQGSWHDTNSDGSCLGCKSSYVLLFDRDRINRLCEALSTTDGSDAVFALNLTLDKILRQSKSELEYLLSKFD